MRWEAWVLVALFSLSTVLMVADTGKPRKARTSGDAVAGLIMCAGLIWLVIRLGIA